MLVNRVKTALLVVLGLIWLAPVYLLVVNASKSVDGYDAKTVWKAGRVLVVRELR